MIQSKSFVGLSLFVDVGLEKLRDVCNVSVVGADVGNILKTLYFLVQQSLQIELVEILRLKILDLVPV